jgi:hypothetical protein
MSYRAQDVSSSPEICIVPSRAKIHVVNGTSTEIAIPCSYAIPSETAEGGYTYEPIHLTTEGYTDPVIAFAANAPTGLTSHAWTDTADDSVIKIVIVAACPSAVIDHVDCEMSILITRDGAPHGVRTDCVLRGHVHIEAAPLPAA